MDDPQTKRIVDWVTQHGFDRIALQFPDAMLPDAPYLVSRVQKALPDKRAFILGDSSFGGGGVDEVGALHYGADCIVRFGHAEQQRGGDLPVLFLFGEQKDLQSFNDMASIASTIRAHDSSLRSDSSCLLVICDLAYQHLGGPLAEALRQQLGKGEGRWRIWMTESHEEASAGDILPRWHDWRWGTVDFARDWWAALGTLTRAAAARPAQLKVCGRVVASVTESGREPCYEHSLPDDTAILYVGLKASTLERCVLLRFGGVCPVWRLCSQAEEFKLSHGSTKVDRVFSDSLLQKRYRFVEAAKSAATVGILLVAAGGPTTLGRALAQRLEILLSKGGRKHYRFVVGQPTQEKLGNFPEVECYVLLCGPEQFTWDVQDLMVPICTPFELEVALGARRWTGEYITDLEELLLSAPMTHLLCDLPAESEVVVQSLGKSRIKSITNASASTTSSQFHSAPSASRPPPASITPGLHGVPWKYSQEESSAA
ncbi:dph2 [Symbiodinium sp. CCMP2592]|nr:dph2 [Symbiodinium sp. CCMP2592]